MEKKYKMKASIKIIGVFCIMFLAGISLLCIYDDYKYDIYELVFIILASALLGGIMLIWTIYMFCFKLVINDKVFTVRKFFTTKTYHIDDITNIDYKRILFGDYAYVLKIGNKKVEISQFLKNKIEIDRYFKDNGIFEKYPRVEI